MTRRTFPSIHLIRNASLAFVSATAATVTFAAPTGCGGEGMGGASTDTSSMNSTGSTGGPSCQADTDCGFPAKVCQANLCVPASCMDGRVDGDETALDCGGSCGPCPNYAPCKGNSECQSGACSASFHACVNCTSPLAASCDPGRYCDMESGICKLTQSNGTACAAGDPCASGNCVDGVCCGTSSCPACNACDINGKGTCSPMPAGADTTAPNTCGDSDATHACDGLGQCLKVQGLACAAGGECLSGNCVDLVCCGTASCPACNACNLDLTGTCSPMPTGPDATAPSTCGGAQSCDGAGNCKKNQGQACASGSECASGVCTGGLCAFRPPSCVGGGIGAGNDCGASGTSDCCASMPVPGGSFLRGYDGGWYPDSSFPATVSSFRLDAYQVTVGRFRKFVSAVLGGWLPAAGSGKHTHLPGGGLNAGTEPGWDTAWNVYLHGTKAAWDVDLDCSADATWTPSAGSNEKRPLGCMHWAQAYAFCIWDGGFLPSEAEWNYAAAGGSEQRAFPWSVPPTALTIDCTYANYMSCVATGINDVGSESPKGDGKWGQTDLGGNVSDATLDGMAPYPLPCNDCATLGGVPFRVAHGGCWFCPTHDLLTSSRLAIDPLSQDSDVGFRCARTP